MVEVKDSPYIVGIDLGTTNSVVAVYKGRKPEVLKVEGKTIIPSVVSYKDLDNPLVGEKAKRSALIYPDKTVTSIKRHIGDSDYKVEIEGTEYNPTQISAKILEHLKFGAQSQEDFDLRGTIKKAVICRPANFDAEKIEATREAAELAGFEQVWLLEEPTAAALAYGLDKKEDQTLLIYDLGGGTFDVCIMKVTHGEGGAKFEVLSTEGIPELGGDDFDRKIMGNLAAQLQEESNLDILDDKKEQGVSVKKIREAQQLLKEEAEKAKIELTDAETTFITIPDIIADESGTSFSIDSELTREKFEELVENLIKQSKEAVDKALDSAGLTVDQVNKILLVGGSTRVPVIKKMVTDMFGREPWADVDPSLCVAQGAAIKGSLLLAELEEADIDEGDVITDEVTVEPLTNYNLGIETKGGTFSTIIEKGVKAPESKTKIYTTSQDNMSSLRISIYQAPDDIQYVSDEGVVFLGEFYLTGIPPAPARTPKIHVTFNVTDENQVEVSATCEGADGVSNDLVIEKQK